MAETMERQKLEVGHSVTISGVTITLVEIEPKAVYFVAAVDTKPKYQKPSDVVMKAQA